MLAAASGLAVVAAHPPLGWWWTSFLAPVLLLAAIDVDAADAADRERRPRAFRLGLLMGLATFLPMLSWLVLPAGFVGWALLSAVQAGFFGLLALAVRPWLRSRWLPLIVAVAWTGVDAWRAIWPLNGFEWGAIAYAHVEGSWLLPVARITGGRGITFFVVLVGAAGYAVARTTLAGLRAREEGPVEYAVTPARAPVAVLLGALLLSVLVTIEPPASSGSLDVLAVQGNDIRHWEEDVTDASFRITSQLRDQTVAATAGGPPPDLTVWPEASIDTDPFSDRGAHFLPLLEEAASSSRHLLAGMNIDGPDPRTGFWRTQLLVDTDARAVGRYDKRRVVPFGEYIPMRTYLEWFPPLRQIPRDILPHPEPHVVTVDDVPVAVLICFETLFQDINRTNVLAGDEPAQLIVTATTDASYGESAQPDQHLAQSRLRAVETGRWVVHAALSGASAFVDPHGGVEQVTDLFTQATIRRQVPLVTGTTPYLLVGDVVGWITRVGVLGLLGFPLWSRLRRRPDVRESVEVDG
ncbi:apolipoprotein N-acyltransferase [Egicoccus halophilus]|uniref:Apolipoprotein N-acyltransferase n=1 Tax=Egicoccus halophilus TaxID=1670830 RepID=A0A8J3ET89_9ACTN|nr:apolipoprotein N-acyltransferase [Egicoccus halophilus]GGI04719.1 apolipoprotein N-acyltransferase [Egicoccus halophilus]